MWLVSFHGGKTPGSVNNIAAYSDSGQPVADAVLPEGGSAPDLRELRGFAAKDDMLYVLESYKKASQVVRYQRGADGQFAFNRVVADGSTVPSVDHPYGLAVAPDGTCYVSSQDTNVVTALGPGGAPLPTAPALRPFGSPQQFLPGTVVASATGSLPDVPAPAPPDVPAPQGLQVELDKGLIHHSVRGVAYDNGSLYVADEPANAVKVYDAKSGALRGLIEGPNLQDPVGLLIHDGRLFIGSTGNGAICSVDLAQGAPSDPSRPVAPKIFAENAPNVSGMACDGQYLYAAERKAKRVERFDLASGRDAGTFISHLPDNPECIAYLPG